MRIFTIIVALCLVCALPLFGQHERLAIENIAKGKWEKAFYQLDRTSYKDTATALTSYGWALYFSALGNPDFALDSASRYIRQAIDRFGRSTAKQRERWLRIDVDSTRLAARMNSIDSAAFAAAKKNATPESYQHFLDVYPGADLAQQAIALRDETAWQRALHLNRYEAFYEYIQRYPRSARLHDATVKYERLLYESYTREGDLAGFERFVREHPNTSCQAIAARNIFEIVTASGSRDAFIKFLEERGGPVKPASDILFHLLGPEEPLPIFAEGVWADSVIRVKQSLPKAIVPFLHEETFGFIDQDGHVVFESVGAAIDDDYLCGNINEDFIRLPHGVVGLNGAFIYRGETEEAEDLGLGLLQVVAKGCTRVYHKSGFAVTQDCVAEALTIANAFLAVRSGTGWSLLTLTGRKIPGRSWDAIRSVNQVVVFEDGGKLFAGTPATLAAAVADPQTTRGYMPVDRVAPWPKRHTWVRVGSKEFLLDPRLDTVAMTSTGSIRPAAFGVVIQNDSSHTVNWNGVQSEAFAEVRISDNSAIVRTSGGWRLFNPVTNAFGSPVFDSLRWNGPFAIGERRDSTYVYFSNGTSLGMKGLVAIELVQGKDSASFLLTRRVKEKKAWLYDRHGRALCQVTADKVQYVGQGYFRISLNGKTGLINTQGKIVVHLEMAAVGALADNSISMLRDQRFGIFNTVTRKMITPQYAVNPVPYGRHHVVVQKNGAVGLVNWENKPVLQTEFDEIRYWNDTSALVRKDWRWLMINLRDQSVIIDRIRDFKFIRQDAHDQLAIVHVDDRFGVLHNRQGTVVPVSFSDVVNLGSPDTPVYFAEKRLGDTSYVIEYYAADGRLLRSEACTAAELERIYCPDN